MKHNTALKSIRVSGTESHQIDLENSYFTCIRILWCRLVFCHKITVFFARCGGISRRTEVSLSLTFGTAKVHHGIINMHA